MSIGSENLSNFVILTETKVITHISIAVLIKCKISLKFYNFVIVNLDHCSLPLVLKIVIKSIKRGVGLGFMLGALEALWGFQPGIGVCGP